MKPSWSDAPEWAKWLAMDGDGWWMWYSDEPYWSDEVSGWTIPYGVSGEFGAASDGPDESGIDWDFAYSTREGRNG